MAFHFRFQSLLRARQALERNEELRLHVILRQLRSLNEELTVVLQENRACSRRISEATQRGTTGAELRFEALCASQRAHHRDILQQKIIETEKLRSAQQGVLLQASKNREVLEQLRARQLELYRLTESRRQQSQLDELFLLKF